MAPGDEHVANRSDGCGGVRGRAAISGQIRPSIADLKTTPEATAFKSTSTYDDVVRFMKAVDDASPVIYSTTYGTTSEGRAMPMAVVGTGLKDGSAASVKATGKLRVHIQGNIHAGEVEGKESALVLLREFAAGQHADWLQSTVFLITPIFNADGNEKFALTNRPRQNGPINGMGTRQNAQGLNINRDFMKLDTPEGRAFAKLWVDYDPHVGIDLHTSNGSNHGYFLTYSPPLNPNTSDLIMKIQRDEWFPFITTNIKAKHGWDTFYYGNAGNPNGRGGRGRGPGARPAAAAGRGGAAADGRPPPASAARPAGVADVRARAAVSQQLRRAAQPLRAAQRGLLVRDVRGSHQGHELLSRRGADLRASERRPPGSRGGGRRRRGDRRDHRIDAVAHPARRHDRHPDGRSRGRGEPEQRRHHEPAQERRADRADDRHAVVRAVGHRGGACGVLRAGRRPRASSICCARTACR